MWNGSLFYEAHYIKVDLHYNRLNKRCKVFVFCIYLSTYFLYPLLLFAAVIVTTSKWSTPWQELCNLLVQVKSMGSGAAWLYKAKSCIRLRSNVLDNNLDWADPAHMRGDEVYAHLRLRMEWPPPRLIK